ncbi:hypothetical protein [Microbaculum marinisediminis]|uniref:Uncharacterized protein n=1 Tax=Microbaculum marinisediminis TaxID=2931392 RepID=A0AAW5QU87_9HYPH|nr:hypothetical protein [Microbaculum sp. A6E488]MCT8970570.1 hypothetical protein [Microbaculum sp. A6E488]
MADRFSLGPPELGLATVGPAAARLAKMVIELALETHPNPCCPLVRVAMVPRKGERSYPFGRVYRGPAFERRSLTGRRN